MVVRSKTGVADDWNSIREELDRRFESLKTAYGQGAKTLLRQRLNAYMGFVLGNESLVGVFTELARYREEMKGDAKTQEIFKSLPRLFDQVLTGLISEIASHPKNPALTSLLQPMGPYSDLRQARAALEFTKESVQTVGGGKYAKQAKMDPGAWAIENWLVLIQYIFTGLEPVAEQFPDLADPVAQIRDAKEYLAEKWLYPLREKPTAAFERVADIYHRGTAKGMTDSDSFLKDMRKRWGGQVGKNTSADSFLEDIQIVHTTLLDHIAEEGHQVEKGQDVTAKELSEPEREHLRDVGKRINENLSEWCKAKQQGRIEQIIGSSDHTLRLFDEIDKASKNDEPVLLLAETGVGKNLATKAIHANSKRSGGKVNEVNLGGLESGVFRSELFGAVKGAGSDSAAREGWFKATERGTLLLDEIGSISQTDQSALLKAVEEKKVSPVGSTEGYIEVDVRVIGATNEPEKLRDDLEGRFRQKVSILPLRERWTDARDIAEHVAKKENKDVEWVLHNMEQSNWRTEIKKLNVRGIQRLVDNAPDASPEDMAPAPPPPPPVTRTEERPNGHWHKQWQKTGHGKGCNHELRTKLVAQAMRETGKRSHKDIAALFNVPPGTIGRYVTEALAEFKETGKA